MVALVVVCDKRSPTIGTGEYIAWTIPSGGFNGTSSPTAITCSGVGGNPCSSSVAAGTRPPVTVTRRATATAAAPTFQKFAPTCRQAPCSIRGKGPRFEYSSVPRKRYVHIPYFHQVCCENSWIVRELLHKVLNVGFGDRCQSGSRVGFATRLIYSIYIQRPNHFTVPYVYCFAPVSFRHKPTLSHRGISGGVTFPHSTANNIPEVKNIKKRNAPNFEKAILFNFFKISGKCRFSEDCFHRAAALSRVCRQTGTIAVGAQCYYSYYYFITDNIYDRYIINHNISTTFLHFPLLLLLCVFFEVVTSSFSSLSSVSFSLS